jgi:hypothetical protein
VDCCRHQTKPMTFSSAITEVLVMPWKPLRQSVLVWAWHAVASNAQAAGRCLDGCQPWCSLVTAHLLRPHSTPLPYLQGHGSRHNIPGRKILGSGSIPAQHKSGHIWPHTLGMVKK